MVQLLLDTYAAKVEVDAAAPGAGAVFVTTLREGGVIRERIESLDGDERCMRYRVLDAGPLPYANYRGEARVQPCGPDGCVVSFQCGVTIEYVAIHLPRVLLQRGPRSFYQSVDGAGSPVPVKVVSREKAASLLPIMVRTLCADLPVDRLLYILTPILCQLLDIPSPDADLLTERDVLHPAVSKAQSIIRDQCADRVDVSDLATSVDLDMRYLISLFKLSTGTTPHQFQIALRVEMARALLEQQLPLCEVAARAGFADQSHLNRLFRRRYGFTPGVFREAVVMRPSIVV